MFFLQLRLDFLFEHQKALDHSHLVEYAQKVGLDIERFKKDMSGHVYAPLIDDSLKTGIDSGVEGTPTLSMECVMKILGIWEHFLLLP
ncbi:MAG: DsbA family protein [Nitrososphaeraceae archaeon]